MPKITKIYDNIVLIEGKYKYEQDMIFNLSKDAKGYLLSATKDSASLLVIGDPSSIVKDGKEIKKSTTKIVDIPVYKEYFGSIISPFGDLLQGSSKVSKKPLGIGHLDASAPALLDRVKLSDPLETGIISIDTMIPIGMGQRELIIGDRATGKTAIAINTIINQRKKKVKSIYVSVGSKRSDISEIYETLKENNADKDTIIIFSSPDSASEQFFAPRVGMAMAEVFAYQGENVLLIIDDLTKHANIYREISLSIEKNPGREAYPTDIFYRHSKLLERAGRFNSKYKNGSITCLPIVKTVGGNVASIIPSNVISITDGQIFTSTDMANNAEFPAINIGLSVSRTGSAVQSKELKQISKGLKAKYLELFDIKKFADMSIDISDELQNKIQDWYAINNLLIQNGNLGYSKEKMFILIELFKMQALNKIKDKAKFATAFNNYCTNDKVANKFVSSIKGSIKPSVAISKQIETIFVPLVKIASDIENGIISKEEYAVIRKGKKW